MIDFCDNTFTQCRLDFFEKKLSWQDMVDALDGTRLTPLDMILDIAEYDTALDGDL